MKKLKKVRLGIVGTGSMGNFHLAYANNLEGAELTAVCDINPETLKAVSEKHPEAKAYDNHRKMLADSACDAVLIATPHYFHPPIAIDCFKKGVHVLSEKPVAVYTQAAKQAINYHKKHAPKLVYTAMFMCRTMPVWAKAKQIIESGRLGEFRRVTWIVTNWFRTQSYYDSGGWRATWAGEGGGVLLNQCPHNLDLITWLAGVPKRVTASVSIGKYHNIEVEDDVNAFLEYKNGATGNFITTTGEAPGTDRLEIVGDLGKMVVESGKIHLTTTQSSIQEYCDTSKELFKGPQFTREEVELPPMKMGAHQTITQNFINAILKGEKLVVQPEEGINGLTLGNAILMSGLKREPVKVPFNDAEYRRMIEELAAKSKFRKVVKKAGKTSMSDSFH